jgi:hypothetical protein
LLKFGVHDQVADEFEALIANVLPVVGGLLVLVKDVTGWPSGSFAVSVKVISVFSAPEAVAGAVTTGARSTLFTVTVVDAEFERLFVAVNVTVYVPACVKLGVHENVPDVFVPFVVNVLPVVAGEEDAVNEVIAWPSASAAVTVKVISVFSFPEAEAGAVTVGGRSPTTARVVAAVPESAFDAVNVSVYVPFWAMFGVQLNVPDVFPAPAVNVLPVVAGPLDSVRDVIA